jgi:two-component system sensor histidine kinase KdpD
MSRPETRVEESLARYHGARGDSTGRGHECVVVALTGGPESATLLRRGARLAARGDGRLHAVYAARPSRAGGVLAPSDLAKLRDLADDLGGAFHAVVADDEAEAVLELARGVHATTIVVGVSRRPRWTAPFRTGVSDRIVTGSGDIDVLMVTHPYARTAPLRSHGRANQALSRPRRLAGWVLAITTPLLLTAVLRPLDGSPTPASEGLAFIVVTVVSALVGGLWPALTAGLLSGLLLNFFFTPPLHTLTIASAEDVSTLLLFLLVAVLVASVVGTAARRSEQAGQARREADTLSMLNQTLLRGDHDIAALLGLVCDTFAVRSAALLHRPETAGSERWQVLASSGPEPPRTPEEADATAEASTSTRLVLRGRALPAQDMRVLNAFATHLAVVADRERLASQTAAAQRLAEGNRMRTALLAAVSHDLRTPLAGIKAAVSTLRTAEVNWSAEDQAELLAAIESSTDKLSTIIANLLDMSRLQTGAVHLVTQEVGLDDVVSRALRTLPATERVDLDIAPDLPPVCVDSGLLERVAANLVENALRYSPPDTRVLVNAEVAGTRVRLRVVDHGPGVPEPSKDRLFQPFQRLGDAPAGEGVGLGLAVAAGLARALGGELTAHDTPGGGLTMVVDLAAGPETPIAREPGQEEHLDTASSGGPT